MTTHTKIVIQLILSTALLAGGIAVGHHCANATGEDDTTGKLSTELDAKTDELAKQHIEDIATTAKAKRATADAKVQSEIQHEVSTSGLADYLRGVASESAK